MSDYDNQIGLWKRIPKKDASGNSLDTHYNGNITVGGKKMNLAAWLNTEKTKEGQPDISLKISEIVAKEEAPF